jgi:hypothetical protein
MLSYRDKLHSPDIPLPEHFNKSLGRKYFNSIIGDPLSPSQQTTNRRLISSWRGFRQIGAN